MLYLYFTDHWNRLQLPMRNISGRMRDVWDGQLLRRLRGVFSRKTDIALSLNTDGVAIFKSSSWSLWPVFLSILNLPIELRMKAENILLVGLWYGPTKKNMKLFLESIMTSLHPLLGDSVSIRTPEGDRPMRVKVVMGVLDLPAKAAVLCMKQFNGEHGCAVCLHPGTRLDNGARIYKPEEHDHHTHTRIVDAGRAASRRASAVDGVKDVSPLAPYMDLVLSFPVDYMHNVLEGVVRTLMGSLFFFTTSLLYTGTTSAYWFVQSRSC